LPAATDEDSEDLRRLRIKIEMGRARAGFTFLAEGEGVAIVEPLLADARDLGDLRLEADLLLTITLLLQFRGVSPEEDELLSSSLSRISAIAAELNDPFIAALPQSIIGLFKVFTGDLRGGTSLLEETAPQLASKHDYVGSSFALMALGMGYARQGEFEKAEATIEHAVDLADQGDIIARIDTLIGKSWISSIKGDLDKGVPLAIQCADMAENAGASACVVASNFILGDMYMRQGKFGDAKIVLDRSESVANALEQRQFRPSIVALVRLNSVHLGELGGKTGTFEEALDEADSIGDRWAEATIYWKRAETVARMGRVEANREQVLSDFAEAAKEFDDMGARPFLARVLRDWGNVLRGLGRFDEGDAKLRQAISLFDEMGISREAAEARAEIEGASGS
jgi:tetratricopeptide (TPR) repeat protein